MNFLLYVLPLVIFVLSSIMMYIISEDPEKNNFGTILLRNVFPAALVSIMVFIILKFKDSQMFNHEPMMSGNYFD